MIEDEEQGKKPQELIIGADLDAVSVGELQERITLLQAEIERIGTIIGEKEHSKTAAEGFFKK